MGDPETQPIMARLKSDLVDICLSTLEGELQEREAVWDTRAALGVVMAAGGYPASYAKGKVITGLEGTDSDTQKVLHAGTATDGDEVTTSGGRVLCVVGLGDTVAEAARDAYAAVDKIDWEDVYIRRDIGHRAIARENA
jgi:phosphoribosylamine--glycine ligase